jgi:hypothetical protein
MAQDDSAEDQQLQLLILRHRELDKQADKLSSYRHLTPVEWTALKELKVMRLYAKEAIDRYKRSPPAQLESNIE